MPQIILNNRQTSLLPLIVNPAQLVDPEYLIYAGNGGNNYNNSGDLLQKDNVSPSLLYHGGHKRYTAEIKFEDCNNLQTEVSKQEFISSEFTKGITRLDGSTWFWDELLTTPMGLFKENSVVGVYNFKLTNLREITINVGDVSIIPTSGDWLIIQKYFETEFTLPSPQNTTVSTGNYTDDIDSLPLFQSELWQFQILSVLQGSTATEWIITIDKDFTPHSDGYYTFVLLNREETQSIREQFIDTWQKIEVQSEQILGDQYNYTGSLKPKGATNFLDYDGSEYLGLHNFLGHIDSNAIKDSKKFLVFDYDNNIQDHIYYLDDSFRIYLPGIMSQFKDGVISLNNFGKATDSYVGDWGKLYYNNEDDEKVYVGYIFYDLRICIVIDPEIVMALSYNSNRNYTLPAPVLEAVNKLQETTVIDITTVVTQPYSHFLTYRLKGTHYDTLPYNDLIQFNWHNPIVTNTNPDLYTVEFTLPELLWLVDDIRLTGYEADQFEVIIGKYIIDNTDPLNPVQAGVEDVVVMPMLDYQVDATTFDLKDTGIKKSEYRVKFFKQQYDAAVTALSFYDLTQFWGDGTPDQLFVGKMKWTIGNVQFKTYTNQYRMQVDYKLDADKWNGSLNSTFDCESNFQKAKLITEVGLKIGADGDDHPMIYAKISPPIPKQNETNLIVKFNIDF